MRSRLRLSLLALSAVLVAAPAAAQAEPYNPPACQQGSAAAAQVIVHYEPGTPAAAKSSIERQTGTGAAQPVPGGSEQLRILDGDSVGKTVRELNAKPAVAYAVPNELAHASGFYPDDPGNGGGWRRLQWNFDGPASIHAPDAWQSAIRAGAPGGRGAVVAVLDTGVAYQTRAGFRRSPDFSTTQWKPGYDFVDNDRYPNDANGHGTHVAGTIAEQTNNHTGVTGLAYGATIMPVRVLDTCGDGDAANISRAIRYAAKHGANVLNMSFEFEQGVRASDIPSIMSAIRYAHNRGAVMVGAAGNHLDDRPTPVSYPARARYVIGVGATTQHLCQAEYSNSGYGLDIAAPGGGYDADLRDDPWDAAHCNTLTGGRDVYQETFTQSVRSFGLPSGFEGTSMATPHVAATAALYIAVQRRLGHHPTPDQVEARLEGTARDLGPPGPDGRYGHGLVDAAAVLDPSR